jgi:hypothetical protein
VADAVATDSRRRRICDLVANVVGGILHSYILGQNGKGVGLNRIARAERD